MTNISIPAPKFDLHELVTFHWNGEQTKTRITVRRYDIDEECWMYGIAGSDSLVFETHLESRE